MALSNDKIVEMLKKMDKESKAFKKELIHLAWSMRGGLTLNEAYALSPSQREHIAELFKENLETTKAAGIPFF